MALPLEAGGRARTVPLNKFGGNSLSAPSFQPAPHSQCGYTNFLLHKKTTSRHCRSCCCPKVNEFLFLWEQAVPGAPCTQRDGASPDCSIQQGQRTGLGVGRSKPGSVWNPSAFHPKMWEEQERQCVLQQSCCSLAQGLVDVEKAGKGIKESPGLEVLLGLGVPVPAPGHECLSWFEHIAPHKMETQSRGRASLSWEGPQGSQSD